jgi:hypothetical protein
MKNTRLTRFAASGVLTSGGVALGAIAIGTMAIGAAATGACAISALTIRKVKQLHIDRLTIGEERPVTTPLSK